MKKAILRFSTLLLNKVFNSSNLSKSIFILGFILIGSFVLFAPQSSLYDKDIDYESTDNNSNSTVVIGYSNWVGWWPWAIAEKKGFFDKHGVSAELVWYDDYTKSLTDLKNGSIDANCQTLSDTISFSKGAVKGEVVVLVNDNSAGNDKIIAASQIKGVEDLRTRKVGLEVGVVDDFLLTLALDEAGISRNDIEILNSETGAAVEAFIAGEVDAVGAFPPFWYEALSRRKGAHEIVSSADFPGAIPDLLVVTKEMAEQHEEEVQALIDIWFDILDFMSTNTDEADSIMATRAEIDSQQELQMLKQGTKMFNLQDNLNAFNKGNSMKSLHYASRKIYRFLKKYNFLNSKLDLSNLLNPQFVRTHYKQKGIQ